MVSFFFQSWPQDSVNHEFAKDMGLGKTLQTLCIVASDHEMRKCNYVETQSPEFVCLPSLIICPSTLVTHWYRETLRFTPTLQPVMYMGSNTRRDE
jgi:TATA-binding protein-associated factor